MQKLIIICVICLKYFAHSYDNIASGKQAFQSATKQNGDNHYVAGKAVDGIYDQTPDDQHFCAVNSGPYAGLRWLEVDLVDMYYISSVILTPGVAPDTNAIDNVYIGISNSNVSGNNEYPVYPLCRQSPYTADATKNMSIPCRPNTPPGRYVIVQQPAQYTSLTICEIQIYGTILKNNVCQRNYYGDKCDKYCNCDKGVKCDQYGICPNGCDANWEGQHCDIRKYASNQISGCFKVPTAQPPLLHEFSRTVPITCVTICSGYGFTFASSKGTDKCLCTDSLTWAVPCGNGDLSGGYEATFYAVCPSGTYGYNCTLKCNCRNNGRCSYMDGRCDGGCADGWTGDSCDIRDCSKYNGGCGDNENCVSRLNDPTACECKAGFSRTYIWSPCQSLPISSSGKTFGNKLVISAAIIGGIFVAVAGITVF